MIVIVVLVLLLVAGGGAYYYFMVYAKRDKKDTATNKVGPAALAPSDDAASSKDSLLPEGTKTLSKAGEQRWNLPALFLR